MYFMFVSTHDDNDDNDDSNNSDKKNKATKGFINKSLLQGVGTIINQNCLKLIHQDQLFRDIEDIQMNTLVIEVEPYENENDFCL